MDIFEQLYIQLSRHVVMLTYYDRSPKYAGLLGGLGQSNIKSGFLISAHGQCFLITAGHILDRIQDLLDQGSNLVAFALRYGLSRYLRDGLEECPTTPFAYSEANKFYLPWGDEKGDYGYIRIRPDYIELLVEYDTVPFPAENVCRYDIFDHFQVIGFPKQLIDTGQAVESKQIMASLTNVALERVADADLPFSIKADQADKKGDYIYCRLPHQEIMQAEGQVLTNIDGLSGSPIFGFRSEDGKVECGLVAIQSGWYPGERILVGCGMLPLVRAIDVVLSELESSEKQSHSSTRMAG